MFADDTTEHEVYTTVEYVMDETLFYGYDESITPNLLIPNLLISFEIGVLGYDEEYTTEEFHLSETKLIINMASWYSASKDIRVSLYSSAGNLVGADNIDLARGAPTYSTTARVTFNNLVAGDYYVVVKNLAQEDSGTLLGNVTEQ